MLEDHNAQSSLYEKLTPDERTAIDRAIAFRDPPTYTAVFKKFALEKKGLSFAAFYRYARRIRRQVELIRISDLTGPDPSQTRDMVHRLVGSTLVEMLGEPDRMTPLNVSRLVKAHYNTREKETIRLRNGRERRASSTRLTPAIQIE